MRRKLFALALSLVLFANIQLNTTLTVLAAEQCRHTNGLKYGVSIVDHWTTWHKGVTKYSTDGSRIYVDCLITYEVIRHQYYCEDCHTVVTYNDETKEYHSEKHY